MRISTLLVSMAATLAFATAPAAPGSAAALPRPAFLLPDPGFAELGGLPDPLTPGDLGRAALLASGLAPGGLASYEARIDSLCGELRGEAGGIADPAARGEAVLGFLHRRVFKAYREDATTLDGILDTGIYNCVSSAVLYMLAAESLGLEVEGVRTSDHAFCVLSAGGRKIDVETTNPYGFDPGNKKEFKDSFGRATGYAYVAPGGYGYRTAIDGRSLVSLILWNRASMLERQRRFADAARLGVDCDELVRDGESRTFLLQRISNLVADLEAKRDYAGAESAARSAAGAYPGEGRLAALAMTAEYNRAATLANAGDYAGAFELLAGTVAAVAASASAAGEAAVAPDGTPAPSAKEWAALMSDALVGLARSFSAKGGYDDARRAVAERADRAGPEAAAKAYAAVGEGELVAAVNTLGFAEAARTADRIYAAGEVDASRYAQATAAIYGNEAGRMGKTGDWLGGAAVAEEGLVKLAAAKAPGDFGLGRLSENLRRNFVVDAHNRFARLYNAGDYSSAAAEVRKALASLPGETSLEADLAEAEKAAGGSGAR